MLGLGEIKAAIVTFNLSLKLKRKIGLLDSMCITYCNLSIAHARAKSIRSATYWLTQANQCFELLGLEFQKAYLYRELGYEFYLLANYEVQGKRLMLEAHKLYVNMKSRQGVSHTENMMRKLKIRFS